MERSAADSDFVLIVYTPTYAKKAEKRDGGVGYEAMVITGRLASNISQGKMHSVAQSRQLASLGTCLAPDEVGLDMSSMPYSRAAYD